MKIQFSNELGLVKLALMDTIAKSDQRRLVSKEQIPCKSGCSGCCSRLVEITMAEAVLIYDDLYQKKLWPQVRVVAKGQAPMIKDIPPMSWFKMNLKCPILDQSKQTCLAYPIRPAICSTHFVSSDASMCDPWSSNSNAFKSLDFIDLLIEFRERASSHIEGYGILSLELPVPTALLLAERINTLSGLSIDQVMSIMYSELSK